MMVTEEFKGESIWGVTRELTDRNPAEFVAERQAIDGKNFEAYRSGAVLPDRDEAGRRKRVWFEVLTDG